MQGIEAYLTAFAGIALLMAAWVLVQMAWARIFPDQIGDGDVLAARGDCHGCGHAKRCGRNREGCSRGQSEGRG